VEFFGILRCAQDDSKTKGKAKKAQREILSVATRGKQKQIPFGNDNQKGKRTKAKYQV